MFIHVFYNSTFIKTLKFEDKIFEISIGRIENNDVSLEFDELISRNHAKISFQNDKIEIEDCSSKNGIFVDNEKILKKVISYEKKIYLGNSSIIISKFQFKEMKQTIILNNKLLDEIKQDIDITGTDIKTLELKKMIQKVAPTKTTVLITGESGTGKELVAKFIHKLSQRKERPLIIINCASIPEHLIESEFFGHLKGSFTGADKLRIGKFESADGGTVFLDEIGDMPYNLQTKLLRFLELGEIQPIGSNETKFCDVRIIAATNKDLNKSMENNLFRKDLFYRLSVFQIFCPPLRERKSDILDLINFYLKKDSLIIGRNIAKISPDAAKILLNYYWPGNIRELKNVMERACILAEGDTLTLELLPFNLENNNFINLDIEEGLTFLEQTEKNQIFKVFSDSKQNIAKASKILGITRKTLYVKLKKYGIVINSKK